MWRTLVLVNKSWGHMPHRKSRHTRGSWKSWACAAEGWAGAVHAQFATGRAHRDGCARAIAIAVHAHQLVQHSSRCVNHGYSPPSAGGSTARSCDQNAIHLYLSKRRRFESLPFYRSANRDACMRGTILKPRCCSVGGGELGGLHRFQQAIMLPIMSRGCRAGIVLLLVAAVASTQGERLTAEREEGALEPAKHRAVPVDCVVTAWSPYSNCTQPCDGGTQVRVRGIIVEGAEGGRACPELRQERYCNTKPCPVDCAVSAWSPWTNCTAPCGGGMQTRRRHIVQHADHGGQQCPDLVQARNCSSQPCTRHCVVTEWSAWGNCSVKCGGGLQFRSRSISAPATGSGSACPPLRDGRSCNTQPCPQDCRTTPWSAWSPCSAQCSGGMQYRNRTVLQPALFGGQACPLLNATRACNTRPCPEDCLLSDWSAWGNCSSWCGSGEQTRQRHILRAAREGGAPCGTLNETKACHVLRPCPVDCAMGNWTAWSPCSAGCGPGVQNRTRRVLRRDQHGGRACSSAVEARDCLVTQCPVDCEVSAWGAWGRCEPCGPAGMQRRSRWVIRADDYGGLPCPPLNEIQNCSRPCPTPCKLTEWEPVTPCTERCGGGIRTVRRAVAEQAAHGGAPCLADMERIQPCNTFPCAEPIVEERCAVAKTCTSCLLIDGCGWSSTAEACLQGNHSMPVARWSASAAYMHDAQNEYVRTLRAISWEFSHCTAAECSDYTAGRSCVADWRCGWCEATGECLPADRHGSLRAHCAAQHWVQWPGFAAMQSGAKQGSRWEDSRERAQAYFDAPAEQRDAVWQLTAALLVPPSERNSCAPCAGAWPQCECTRAAVAE